MSLLAPAAIGRGWTLIRTTPRSRAPRALAAAVGMLLACACLFGSANAGAASFTWVGEAATPKWSSAANWSNTGHPAAETSIETLVFPHLTPVGCYQHPPLLTCFASENDLHGLSVGEIQLDDADGYALSGTGLTLGTGGIVAEGATGSGDPASLTLPIDLGASQTWLISGGPSGENGVAVGGELSGSGSALTVTLKERGSLFFYGGAEAETGDVAIESSGGSRGFVLLAESAINETDGHSLALRGVALEAFEAATGALSLENAITLVGTFEFDEETGETVGVSATLATKGASLNGGTLDIPINGTGVVAGNAFSQLTSSGAVSISGSLLDVSDQFEGGCPAVPVGQVDTLISADGELTGSFSNAPESSTLTTTCLTPSLETVSGESFRINYHRGTSHSTVTATAIVGEGQEKRERAEREEREISEVREHAATLQQERLVRERAIKEREVARAGQERAVKEGRERAERESREKAEAAAIAVMLAKIVPSGKAAKIPVILKHGFSFALTAAGAGTLTISWYEVPHGAHLSKKAKPVLVATGTKTFAGAGTGKLVVKVTGAGKRLLAHAKRMSLTAKGAFARAGKPSSTARKNFVLKR